MHLLNHIGGVSPIFHQEFSYGKKNIYLAVNLGKGLVQNIVFLLVRIKFHYRFLSA